MVLASSIFEYDEQGVRLRESFPRGFLSATRVRPTKLEYRKGVEKKG